MTGDKEDVKCFHPYHDIPKIKINVNTKLLYFTLAEGDRIML